MLNRLIHFITGKSDPASASPRLLFGRYSDNNKTVTKSNRWNDAEYLFKEKRYMDSIGAFFDYLRDDDQRNVHFSSRTENADFEFFQGSKSIKGRIEKGVLTAEVKLARMPQPSVPVMRRLLEMNFGLYYSRFALDKDVLCMRFDTHIETASPSKLYYGLKELAVKSDKQDDLLVQDFSFLETINEEHLEDIPEEEKRVKYEAMQAWISETLEKIASVDADKYSAGISHLLLGLVYRIDFLIAPEGRVMSDLEKIGGLYFDNADRLTTEKNRDMMNAFQQLKEKPQEEIFRNLFRSKYTFSIVVPQPHQAMAGVLDDATKNMLWYRDNNQEYFANKIMEYGLCYCQYSYSLPRPVTQFIEIFMQVNYPEYFKALGYNQLLFKPADNRFNQDLIVSRIRSIQNQWRQKYPLMNFRTDLLVFTSLTRFNQSFLSQIELLNLNSE